MVLECLQRWRLHSFPGKLVPEFSLPHGKVFLDFQKELLWFSSCSLLLVQCLGTTGNNLALSTCIQVFICITKIPVEPSLLQAKQFQLYQPSPTGEVLPFIHHFVALNLTFFSLSISCICTGEPITGHSTPGMATPVLSRITSFYLLQPRILLVFLYSSVSAGLESAILVLSRGRGSSLSICWQYFAQQGLDNISLFCSKNIWLAPIQNLAPGGPGSFPSFPQSHFPAGWSLACSVPWFVLSQVQATAFLFVELHEVLINPFLHITKVPLNDRTLWSVSCFCILSSADFLKVHSA